MCGIAYILRRDTKSAAKQVYKRYKKQKGRGEDGFGFVAIDDNGFVKKVRRFQFEHQVERALDSIDASQVLFHHRFPTSTPNLAEMSHPIDVSHAELKYDYLVVHNGVIANADDLKDVHEGLGYKYTTLLEQTYRTAGGKLYDAAPMFNDSESLAIELARTIEGLQGVANAEGPIAYMVVQVEKKSDRAVAIYYGTNGKNPLCLTEQKDFIAIASEGGRQIPSHTCFRLDMATHAITEVPEVKLVGHDVVYVRQPNTGIYNHGRLHWDDDFGMGYVKTGTSPGVSDAWALESELEEIDGELELLKEDAQYAVDNGETEQEDALKYEIKGLMKRRDQVEGLLLKKDLAGATE